MMIVFYLLLILRVGQCADQIIERKTVDVGSDVKLSCALGSSGSLFWFRVVSGNFPKFLGKTHDFKSDSRITVTEGSGTFDLHIKKATLSDTAVYYCIKTSQKTLTFFKATDLKVKGPEPDITAVPPSDPVRPGDSVIQEKCSVLSDSEINTCPGEHSVCCVRAGSHQYHPGFNYTQGNSVEVHEKNPEGLSTKEFIYSFFMNVTSSDAGSYYCAVATCEERFSGNRSKLDAEDTRNLQKDNTILFLLCAALATSLIVIAVLIYSIKKLKKKSRGVCNAAVVLKTNVEMASQQTDEDLLVYSAPTFSGRKARTGGSNHSKTAEEESIYTGVRAQGLD